ncbi:hypothetical protein [Cryobacterium psychrophilum]|uniref:Lipoprotein n=1 Tax=Cryobacterium psychrophilum TaxID=41988 RepID=A0A4Y8KT29_9MICO|nr:hypothetical protein [Cryobacterium psychrophilum]TDW28672.1 hypothetical protein EDD25_0299 [Cryobacterium psychrophilum]TFD82332.1 hypothetical protein E3T53_00175 [Cryobacterium psychrophilum]
MTANFPRIALAGLSIAFSVLVLSGCSSDSSGVGAFDRDQTEADVLPAELQDVASVSPESTRLLAVIDDVEYFAAKAITTGDPCLVAAPEPGDWTVACSPSLPLISSNSGGTKVQLTSIDRLSDADGWHFVADNLAIQEAG